MWNGYTKRQISRKAKEGKAAIFGDGVVYVEEGGKVFCCTWDNAVGRYTRCFGTSVSPRKLQSWLRLTPELAKIR